MTPIAATVPANALFFVRVPSEVGFEVAEVRLAEVMLTLLLDVAEALAVRMLTIMGIKFEGTGDGVTVAGYMAISCVSMPATIDSAAISSAGTGVVWGMLWNKGNFLELDEQVQFGTMVMYTMLVMVGNTAEQVISEDAGTRLTSAYLEPAQQLNVAYLYEVPYRTSAPYEPPKRWQQPGCDVCLRLGWALRSKRCCHVECPLPRKTGQCWIWAIFARYNAPRVIDTAVHDSAIAHPPSDVAEA